MSNSGNRFSILHIDDDKVDTMIIGRAIRKLGEAYHVDSAHNGLDALMMLKGMSDVKIKKPDIILLDINMPLMNGLEFLKELRDDPDLSSIHVCVLTTSSDESDIETAQRYNVAGYIIKPLNISEFDDTFTVLDKYWKMNQFE
jgi:CheY-like chemotaxis protein